jgi:glycosyltransferase involved in cell wall biosynthesis
LPDEVAVQILVDGQVFQYTQTGVAKVTLGLYQALLQADPALQVSFVCRSGALHAVPAGALQIAVPTYVPARLWRRLVVPAVSRWQRPDVVHFPWNGRVGPSLAGCVVVTIHDVLPLAIPSYFATEKEESAYRRAMSRDLARGNVIITDSEFSKSEIGRHFHPAIEPVVIPPATGIADVADDGSRGSIAGYFLYVGGYAPRKGIDDLLRAFREGRQVGKIHQRLLLIGEPAHVSVECTRLIAEGKEGGFIEERGYVDESQLASLYRHATALVYPSRYEGFGLPPLEALTLGCPVLTTRSTSLPEVCGDAAVYVDPSDTASFLDALCALETDEGLRRQLIHRGFVQARRFSWESSAAKFQTLLFEHVR